MRGPPGIDNRTEVLTKKVRNIYTRSRPTSPKILYNKNRWSLDLSLAPVLENIRLFISH